MSRSNNSRMRHNTSSNISSENPMLVILDNCSLMDEPSWKLVELIKDECSRIAIILIVQTDRNNQMKIHPDA